MAGLPGREREGASGVNSMRLNQVLPMQNEIKWAKSEANMHNEMLKDKDKNNPWPMLFS